MPIKQRGYQKSVINPRLCVLVYTKDWLADFFEEWRSFDLSERKFFTPYYIEQSARMFKLRACGIWKMTQDDNVNHEIKLVDWLDEFFVDWDSMTPDQREKVRVKFARKSSELFAKRAQGLLKFPDLTPKKKK